MVDFKRGAEYKVSGAVGGPEEMTAGRTGTFRIHTQPAATARLSPEAWNRPAPRPRSERARK